MKTTTVSSRKKALLILLVLVAAVALYILAYRKPMERKLEDVQRQISAAQDELTIYQARLAKQERMQAELDAIFAENENPPAMTMYDNSRNVMSQLSRIITPVTSDYSVSFATVDTEPQVVRRHISVSFSAGGYEAARDILQALHDSEYRCMIDHFRLDIEQRQHAAGKVSASAQITYFEYNGE